MKYRWLLIIWVPFFVGLLGWQFVYGAENGRNQSGAATAPSLWVNTSSLDFGSVPINQTGWWYFTFKNIGNAPLSITTDAEFAAPFAGTLPACATNLALNASCSYIITFSPTETGSFTDILNFETNAGTFSVQLAGTASVPQFHVNPRALDFGAVAVGNSRSLSATIQNNSGYHIDLNTSSPPSAAFGSSSGDCSGGVAANDSCTVYLSFTPSQTGVQTDTYSITSDAGITLIELQGFGRPTPFFGTFQQVTPRSLDFGPVAIGESKTLTVTVSNQSFSAELTNWVGGGVSAPFATIQNCAFGVTVGNECQFFYTFSPTSVGQFRTKSNVSNSAGNFSVDLQGEGMQAEPLLVETVLDFGPFSSISGHEAALKNIGQERLFINQVNVSNGTLFSPSWGCGAGLAPYLPNTYCAIDYEYTAVSPNPVTETSTIITNGSTVTMTLKAGSMPPTFSQAFLPQLTPPDVPATLRYQIGNPNQATTFFFVEFSDTLPDGITFATPLGLTASPECGQPDLFPLAGEPATFMIQNGTILGGELCQISFNVVASEKGEYINTIGGLHASPDLSMPSWSHEVSPDTATLTVDTVRIFLPFITKN